MDDQNQTNQPLDQNLNPGISSAPEDITPKDTTPLSTVPTTPVAPMTTEPSAPLMAPAEPAAQAPVEPTTGTEPMGMYTSAQAAPETTTVPSETVPPVAQTEASGVPTPSPTPSEQPEQTTTEPTLPEAKPKKKILPVIGGVIALVLVAGVAGAAYYVSNQLSTRQAVAPTAPESKPMAVADSCGTGWTCKNYAGSTACINADGEVESCNNSSGASGNCCVPTGGSTCPSGQAFCGGCINGCRTISTKTCNQLIEEECNDGGGGGGGGGGGSTACGGSGQPECGVPSTGGQANNCPTAPFTYGCGMQCCNTNVNAVCCCTGCFPAGTDCSQHQCSAPVACGDAAHPKDDPAGNSITFSKAGKVTVFMRNAGYNGTITLAKAGAASVSIPFTSSNAKELKTFDVNANDVYTISVKINSESKNSYGWITNKSDSLCGPKKTPGAPLDSNNKATGKCGLDVNISDIRSTALAKTTLDGIIVSGTTTSAAIQCWADAELGDATQDYDFNDFTLVFGYEKQAVAVGACSAIKVYKKVDGVYGTTPLTNAQLKALKVNDVLKFELNSSLDNLKGRFRVTRNTTEVGNWLTGTVDATNKKLVIYSDYTVAAAGTYIFEAQVTTTP